MESFKYDLIDLEVPAFRLLRLCRGRGLAIKCELFQASFDSDDLIPYEALSYTWGSSEMSASVQVNGSTLAVTENLYLALRYLRSWETDRILWVDAVCIDQGNYRERGHQVQQMGKIYSQADRVVIWLGSATDDTDVLMDSLQRLEEESLKFACKDWNLTDPRWVDTWSPLQLLLQGQHWGLASRQCAGLESLLRRPWFKRVWILQEVANAKRAIVCSGTKAVSARFFALAPLLIRVRPEPHCQAVLDIMPGRSREDSWWSQRRDFYTLLLKFNKSKASDPRDMVYALLGLCLDTQDVDSLTADYTKDLQQVVNNAALSLFGLSDCPYRTIPELICNAHLLNTQLLIKAAETQTSNDIADFLRQRGSEVIITEEVVKAAAKNPHSGRGVINLLLLQRSNEVIVTEEVVKAAAANTQSGKEVMGSLICHENNLFMITQSGVAQIVRLFDAEIAELLLRKRNHVPFYWDEVIISAAANTQSGQEVMDFLLNFRGRDIMITEELVQTAAGNPRYGKDIIDLLLNFRGSDIMITEDVVWAAAVNNGCGEEVIDLLLQQRGEEVLITIANGRTELMGLLLNQWGSRIRITEKVVKAAASNTRCGKEMMELLLNLRGSEVKITEEIVHIAAANSRSGKEVINLLLSMRGSEVKITERIVRAALGNTWCGAEVLNILFKRRGEEAVLAAVKSGVKAIDVLISSSGGEVKITEEVLKAAAGNKDGGRVLEYLYGITDINITDGVIESAATSGQEDTLRLIYERSGTGTVPQQWTDIARLRVASDKGDAKTVLQLIKQGVPPDMKDIRGTTPLWHAAKGRCEDVVRILLATNAVDINVQSIDNRTPLFWPAAYGHFGVVKLLLNHGARQHYKDVDGMSPLSIARVYGEYDVVDLLFQYKMGKPDA